MDTNLIRKKIENLIHCIQRIEDKIPPSIEELQSDFDAQDIIILNLERAIQTCVDIGTHLLSDNRNETPQTMAEVFRTLAQNNIIDFPLAENLARSVGFRNIAVHQYQDIDLAIVYAIITKHLEDFKRFIGQIVKHIESSEN